MSAQVEPKTFTSYEAALMLLLKDAISVGTPAAERPQMSEGMKGKVEKLGGLDRAAQIAAQDWPQLVV